MISVLISVYKSNDPYELDEALASLVAQTRPADEVMIVEDGPIPQELSEIIEKYQDKLPITRLPLKTNLGLGGALNEGLKACRYDLVARMDSDDISLPERLEKQAGFFATHPEVGVISAQIDEYDEIMHLKLGERRLPLHHDEIVRFAKKRCPMSHPVVMYRKQLVLDAGGYPEFRWGEDYGLWPLLLTRGVKMANLPETLLKMRCGDTMYARRGWVAFKNESKILWYQHKIGFLSLFETIRNVGLRAAVRLPPPGVKKWLYQHMRG